MFNKYQNQKFLYNTLKDSLNEFIKSVNNNSIRKQDQSQVIFTYNKNIYILKYCNNHFNLEQFTFETKYKGTNKLNVQIQTNLIDVYSFQNNMEIKIQQNRILLSNFDLEKKYATQLFVGQLENQVLKLYEIQTVYNKQGTYSFNKDITNNFIQFEFHPSNQCLILILNNYQNIQYFNIYNNKDISKNELIFTYSTEQMFFTNIINFSINSIQQNHIYFGNIFGHIFIIDLNQVFILYGIEQQQSLEGIYQISKVIQYKSINLNIYNLKNKIQKNGQISQIIILPYPKRQLIAMISFLNEQQIIIQIVTNYQQQMLLLETFTIEIKEQIQLQTQQHILNLFQWQNIQKSEQYLFYQGYLILIQFNNENCNIKQLQIQSDYLIPQKVIPFSFYYGDFLLLNFNNTNLFQFFEIDQIRQPELYFKDMFEKSYFDKKITLQKLREYLIDHKNKIDGLKENDKLLNLEGSIYKEIQTKLTPIIQELNKTDICETISSEELYDIYQIDNEIFNLKSQQQQSDTIIQNGQKIKELYQIYLAQQKDSIDQNKQIKKQNEEKLRQKLISQILKKGKQLNEYY